MDETTEQERLLDYQRARFEEFAVSQGMHGILQGADKNGFYHSNTVNFAHKVWRAAEAPLLERIKELERRLAEANTSAELASKCASTLLAGGTSNPTSSAIFYKGFQQFQRVKNPA